MDKWTFIKRLTYAASYNEITSSVYAIHTWSTTATNAEMKQFVNNDVIKIFLKRAVECEEGVWGKIKGNLRGILSRVGKGGDEAMKVLEGGREVKGAGGVEVSFACPALPRVGEKVGSKRLEWSTDTPRHQRRRKTARRRR
jgi:hypothetical protein